MKKLVLVVLLVLIFGQSCKKEEKFAIEPAISFVSFVKLDDGSGVDNLGQLTIHFQDGDGDLGLNDSDLQPPFDTSSLYYYNFFIDYYRKENGEFVLMDLGDERHARFPRLSNTLPESIEGDISINLYINTLDPSTQFDTMQLSCYIVDRALHKSNEISTPPFIVKKRH